MTRKYIVSKYEVNLFDQYESNSQLYKIKKNFYNLILKVNYRSRSHLNGWICLVKAAYKQIKIK
jgi:hypothetical protein